MHLANIAAGNFAETFRVLPDGDYPTALYRHRI